MQINSDINVLGSLPDWNLVKLFYYKDIKEIESPNGFQSYTHIKTDKSVKRFEKAITATFLQFRYDSLKEIFDAILEKEEIDADIRLFIFWNASLNNELLFYLNQNIFFPAFYSGRVSIKTEEVFACLNELKQTEEDLKKWSESTINVTASKYLTLLKKFGLMEGKVSKTILHPYLNDKMFVLLVYWLCQVSEKSNLLISKWLQYSFSDKNIFIERILKKRFTSFFNVIYTGDKLQVEPLINYNEIYAVLTKS